MFPGLYRDIQFLLDEMSQGYIFTPYDLELSSVMLSIAYVWARMGQQESLLKPLVQQAEQPSSTAKGQIEGAYFEIVVHRMTNQYSIFE
jgi:hypothetical protein